MAKSNQLDCSLVTPKFRMAFVNILDPKVKDDGTKSWEVCMLFDSTTDLGPLKKAAQNARINKWGADQAKWPKGMRSPFRSGDEDNYTKYDGFAGKVVVSTKNTKNPPGLVDANVKPIIDPQEVYSGRWAKAAIRAYAYDAKGNKGVAFWLEHIQLLDHDDSFGGKSRAEDVFQQEDSNAVTDNDMTF